jgi:tRNA-intron endonuclease
MNNIKAHLIGDVISTNSSDAYTLYQKSNFGERIGDKIIYSPSEAIYLVEKGKMEVHQKNGILTQDELMKKLLKIDKKIQTKFAVFRDLRDKGYTVKTALKFGAEFRVYEKGAKMGDKHSKWIVFTDMESKGMTWQEFSSKNRVAHSTKKNLLLAILDEEGDMTYYEIKWVKP